MGNESRIKRNILKRLDQAEFPEADREWLEKHIDQLEKRIASRVRRLSMVDVGNIRRVLSANRTLKEKIHRDLEHYRRFSDIMTAGGLVGILIAVNNTGPLLPDESVMERITEGSPGVAIGIALTAWVVIRGIVAIRAELEEMGIDKDSLNRIIEVFRPMPDHHHDVE